MIEKKTVTPAVGRVKPVDPPVYTSKANKVTTFFYKENYIWMLAGAIVIILGMLVMSGGKSNNPAIFDQKEVYSTTRITIAPLLIVIGLGLEVVAIFKKVKL